MSDIDLDGTARLIRSRIIETSHASGMPHLGSCLSLVDILVAAYFKVLRIDPAHPLDPNRDRFILSKGHGAPALYQILALRGFFNTAMLDNYGADGSLFGEHPCTPDLLPGIEAATGSLGHGLPIALGMALAGRIQKRAYRVMAVLGDGECNEGSVWEAAMVAAAQCLDRVMVIVDANGWQATDRSASITGGASLAAKFRAFGWDARDIDGHDSRALVALMSAPPSGRPVALIAHTVKGKGVSFMEDDNNWHYRIPTAQEVAAAQAELGVL